MNQNLELLSDALFYIEEHLHEKIHTEDISQACYCSKSTLEKIFRCVNDITVRDYLIRRRMTKAARELAADPAYARRLQEQILKFNGQTIEFENLQIPLSLYVGIVRPNLNHLRYSELFTQLHKGLLDSKTSEE